MTAGSSRPIVVLLESVHPDARDELSASAEVVEAEAPDAIPDAIERASAIITRGRGRVTDELLARCEGLRVVARAGVGLDNVDIAAADARDVTVLNVPDALTTTVSEHALALALTARRELTLSADAARSGRWADREHYAGESIAGSRTAVVGLGAIGARTAEMLRAIGADVTVWNRTPREVPGFEADLDRAIDGAEVVSLHVALTPDTRGMVDAAFLGRLAPGATVVNTARPAIVGRDAMLAALDEGRVAAYAVDGFEPEPPPDGDALLRHPRVIVTPHVAALTRSTYRGLCLSTVRGVLDVLAGRTPSDGARRVRG